MVLTETHPLLPDRLPLAVLVNGRTASTGELLAGALRDSYPGSKLIGGSLGP